MITLLTISQDPKFPKRVKDLLAGEDILFSQPATDQKSAMEVVKKDQPNLVLVDLLLPEDSGIDVIKNLEKIKLGASIILLTPVRNRGIIERAMRTGARDVLVLPVSDEELVSTILHRKRLLEENT